MALVLDGNGSMTVGNGDITGINTGALPSTFIGAGAVLQVVQATTTTSTSINSTGYVASNLTGTISPTSATSKILVMYSIGQTATNTTTSFNIRNQIYRSISGGSAGYVGTETNMFSLDARNAGTIYGQSYFQLCQHYLDSPSTTSATTYTIYGKITSQTGSAVVGDFLGFNGQGLLTMMEIAV